jgi:hypothetical protein
LARTGITFIIAPERTLNCGVEYDPARVVVPEKEIEESEPVRVAFQSPPVARREAFVPEIDPDPEILPAWRVLFWIRISRLLGLSP